MIDKLFFSKTRTEVLKLLLFNPGESFYQRQMSALTHQPIRAIQREVKKLELLGVLDKSIQGNRIYYKANRNCPIYDELKRILFKTTGIAQVLKENLGKSGNIQSAFIYGSYAKGQESLSSDVDLFVIGDIPSKGLSSLLSRPKRELGREINYAVFPIEEVRKRMRLKDRFLNTVLRNKKIFIVGDKDELKAITGQR